MKKGSIKGKANAAAYKLKGKAKTGFEVSRKDAKSQSKTSTISNISKTGASKKKTLPRLSRKSAIL